LAGPLSAERAAFYDIFSTDAKRIFTERRQESSRCSNVRGTNKPPLHQRRIAVADLHCNYQIDYRLHEMARSGAKCAGSSDKRTSIMCKWRALRESNPSLQRERLSS
jgi:hypothetical protein